MAELADAPDLGSGGAIHAGSIPVIRTTSEQAIYRLLRFFCKNQSSLMPLLLLFHKRPRSLRLFTCKRVHDGSPSLTPFCGCLPSVGVPVSGFALYFHTSSETLFHFFRLLQKSELAHAAAPPLPQKTSLPSPLNILHNFFACTVIIPEQKVDGNK